MASWSRVFEVVTGRHRRVASHQPGARTSGTPWFIRIFQPHEVDESVMEPAEQHTVVGVGRSAVDVLQNVVDLTPAGRDTAAGDDAAAVAERDRAALVPVEDALFGAEAQDASVVAEVIRWITPAHPTCSAAAIPSGMSQPWACAYPLPRWTSSSRTDTRRVGAAPPIVGSRPLEAATDRALASASCCLLRPGAGVAGMHSLVGVTPLRERVLANRTPLPCRVVVRVEDHAAIAPPPRA